MNVIDLVILVFLLIGAFTGFRKGLLMELISIGAFFIAIILGIKLLDWGIMVLSDYIEGYDGMLPIFSFTIIFLAIIISLYFLGKVVKRVLDLTLFGSLDDIAGSLLGIVKWALFISIFIWIFDSFGGHIDEEMTKTSFLYGPVSSFAPGLFNAFSGLYPYFIEFFDQSQELINQQEVSA
ncbi:MAG: CvpA family protein [Reichenbachiella sp.]